MNDTRKDDELPKLSKKRHEWNRYNQEGNGICICILSKSRNKRH